MDVLADPGTYCYHGEPAWRSYFRSTIAHNTAELGGQNQSSEGGPFLWLRHAHAREIDVTDDGAGSGWTAEHDGYSSLDPPARHRRSVRLDRAARTIDIVDEIDGGSYDIRLAFHLGPDIQAELNGSCALLSWPGTSAPAGAARLELPAQLDWSLLKGETEPIRGWYAYGLGRRTPAFTLVGQGRSAPLFRSAPGSRSMTRDTVSRPLTSRRIIGCARRPGGQASMTQAEALDLLRSLQIGAEAPVRYRVRRSQARKRGPS